MTSGHQNDRYHDQHRDRGHDQGHHHGHHHVVFDSPEMAAHAELEGELFAPMTSTMISRLAGISEREGFEVRRVLDVGSGPGVGTCALAAQFGDADVVAADGAAAMLERVSFRAARLGLAGRVTTRLVELPAGLDALSGFDVCWASMVVHHVGDEVDALRRLRGALVDGGLLALVERAGPQRVRLADDLGRPGMWDRVDAAADAWFAGMRAELPGVATSASYPAMLAAAGFEVLVGEELTLELAPPLEERALTFAARQLSGAASRLGDRLHRDDVIALHALLGDDPVGALRARSDVRVEAARQLYVARAAGAAAGAPS